MARPRIWRSVQWLTPDGAPLREKPPFILPPAIWPRWDEDGELQPISEHEQRVTDFLEHRETMRSRVFNKERMQEERAKYTPEQKARDARRKKTEYAHATPDQRARKNAQKNARAAQRRHAKPFLAIDGEGGGSDSIGRQHYLMMAAAGAPGQTFGKEKRSEFVLRREGRPLSTKDCLDFILSLPGDAIIVGFGVGYDATQILRGITKASTIRRINNPPKGRSKRRRDDSKQKGGWRGTGYTWWSEYGIIWQQGKFLRVCRIDRSKGYPRPLPRSSRTIYEQLGFYQTKFINVANVWQTGTEEEREIIRRNKDLRPEFIEYNDEMLHYCTLECRHLAEAATKFRAVCIDTRCVPERWSGAGELGSAIYEKNNYPKRPLSNWEIQAGIDPGKGPRRPERDEEFEVAAHAAYFGGRAEVPCEGYIPGPIYQRDLNSGLPCRHAWSAVSDAHGMGTPAGR